MPGNPSGQEDLSSTACTYSLTTNRSRGEAWPARPASQAKDPMQAAFVTARGKTCKRVRALGADLAAAFDRIDHDHLVGQLGSFPAWGLVRAWLKAGVIGGRRLSRRFTGSSLRTSHPR